MVTVDATTVKNKFGEMLDRARTETVQVTKSGRNAVVIISTEEYSRLQGIEDQYWIHLASKAEAGGYISEAESMKLLQKLTHEED